MLRATMDGSGENGARKGLEPHRITMNESVREKTGRQRYSEQRERLVNRVADRKEKARLVEINDAKKTLSDSVVVSSMMRESGVPELPDLAQAKFASDLEAQWQREASYDKASSETSDLIDGRDLLNRFQRSVTDSIVDAGTDGVSKNGISGDGKWSKDHNSDLSFESSVEEKSRVSSKNSGDKKIDERIKAGTRKDDERVPARKKDDKVRVGKADFVDRGGDVKKGVRDKSTGKSRESEAKNLHKYKGDEKGGERDRKVLSKKDGRVASSETRGHERAGGVKDGRAVGKTKTDANVKVEMVAKVAETEEERLKREEEERVKLELEEEKKKEEEALKLIEEEKLREEALEKQKEEELNTLKTYVKDMEERITTKNRLREENLASADNRPDESFFFKLDSSLKRNTAFVKKVRGLTESQGEAIIKDFEHLNLSKYIGEVASALTEVKLKMPDVGVAVQLCCLLHQRYADFPQCLYDNLHKVLLSKKDTKIPNPSKLRVDLRFLAELTAVSLFSGNKGLSLLAAQLSFLASLGKDDHTILPILSTFCKHCGDDYAGITPRNIRILSEKHGISVPHNQFLPPERQKACKNLLREYFSSVASDLIKQHKLLKKIELGNLQSLRTKGELSQERKDLYEQAFDGYHKLHANVSTLANLLDEDMPDLPEEELKQDPENALFDICSPSTSELSGDLELFEDEDTRMFYEKLIDLKEIIPSILYKESEQSSVKAEPSKDEESGLEEDLGVDEIEREIEREELLVEGESKEVRDSDDSAIGDTPPLLLPDIPDEDVTETNNVMKAQLDIFLSSLPTCVNRDLIDKASIEFCMNFNTKINRKKLVRALFAVHRTRYDLLPFYSRFVATLYPCMPDVANELVAVLKSEMKWHIRKKIQHNIESKLKTARFIGELVKFKVFSKSECLHLIKMLIFAFTHHNIEMVCAMLETCGRFLYRSKDSHHRTSIYLDVILRKKTAIHLDSRYLALIENAYYYCNPPDIVSIPRKIRPPMHEYLRKLIFRDLSKVTTEKVLRQLRKLDWDNDDVRLYATKCLCQPWNVRYNVIHCLANILSGLQSYYEDVSINVVDGIVEDVRIGMEVNHPRYNQRRICCVKYLAEMYNYRIIESSVVFKVLYSLITFGVTLDDSDVSPLDPPDQLIRLRLVCVLLDTCGQYFDTASSKRRLHCFLIYLQKYYWHKRRGDVWSETRPFPIDIDNLYSDTLDSLQPKTRYESWHEALAAADTLDREFRIKIAKLLPDFKLSIDEEEKVSDMEGLTTVLEEDETEELRDDTTPYPGVEEGGSTLESDNSQGGLSQGNPPTRASGSDTELGGSGDPEEDEKVTVKHGLQHVSCEEDDAFVQAFDKMLNDSLQARTQESLKVPQLDIAVPMRVKVRRPGEDGGGGGQVGERPINFRLITRKGHKQQFSTMEVPISEEFASKYRERERAENEEKKQIKAAVLNMHERQEEEDYQELVASLNRSVTINTNRERRVQYQHPKGAPDADLIFGSKKR